MANPVSKTTKKQEFSAIHDNTSTEVVSITLDRLKLILIEHFQKIESRSSWSVPFSLLVTVVLVFCSASFKEAFGLSADSWAAIFLIVGISSFVWLLRCLYTMKAKQNLDDIIEQIKNKK